MSDDPGVQPLRTATATRKTWWPGWIWAIPLAAIGVVAWLLLRALSSRGVEVTLILDNAAGMADNNTRVLYRGLEVGTVTGLALAPDGRHILAHLDIDKDMSPYVHSGTRFYVEEAHPSLSDLASLKAIISGPNIELIPGPGKPARRFIAIVGKPPEALAIALPYVVTFRGAIGGVVAGSPVELGGFSVGEVESTQLATDARTGEIHTRALLRLDPTRFHLDEAPPGSGDWASLMSAALTQLVAHGLRASVSRAPPLIGPLRITLEMMPDAPPAVLAAVDGYRAIPAVEGGGIEAFSSKLGRVPIDQIGDDVRAITGRLRALVSSPRLDDSIRHLDSTLAELDRTLHASGPQVAPTLRSARRTIDSLRKTAANIDATAAAARAMMHGSAAAPGASLQQALQELTSAARSIRELADYLDQHPEALIRGR